MGNLRQLQNDTSDLDLLKREEKPENFSETLITTAGESKMYTSNKTDELLVLLDEVIEENKSDPDDLIDLLGKIEKKIHFGIEPDGELHKYTLRTKKLMDKELQKSYTLTSEEREDLKRKKRIIDSVYMTSHPFRLLWSKYWWIIPVICFVLFFVILPTLK